MKTASVRDLRLKFGSPLAGLEEGHEIQITPRRRVVARLVPDRAASVAKVRMPDFSAGLKRIHGDRVLSAETTRAVPDENKGRY